ncbi:ABC transporter substrate-binding protein [candidate division WOR-3 bacterium]|nr:ABC transporter substrate-binding protein [candidate division WOR-3 bacterium]
MKKKHLLTLGFSILLVLSCTTLRRDGTEESVYIEDLNRMAFEKYDLGEYSDAIIIFKQILASSPSDSTRQETEYMIALSSYMLGDLPGSEEILLGLTSSGDLPKKNRISALRLLSQIYSDEQAFKEAFVSILDMYDLIPNEDPYKVIAQNKINEISANLSSAELMGIYQAKRTLTLAPDILYFASKAAFSEGNQQESERIWDLLKKNHPDSPLATGSPPFLRRVNPRLVGVIMPLTGQHAQYSTEVINGVKLALRGSNMEILVYDSYGEASQAVQCAKKLIYEEGVIAIIGPLLSSASFEVAKICKEAGVPMLTPTATQEGIGEIGNYIFQLNKPETDEELYVLAQWAVETAGYRRLCVVGGEGYEDDLRKFSDYATNLNAEIAGSWTFPRGTSDYSRISSEIILEEPDAVFISSSVSEIVQLTPTLRFMGCKARFLGSSLWNNDEIVRYGEDAVVGSVFPGKGYYGTETLEFVNGYTEQYGREPSRVARLGYDSMKIILVAAQNRVFENSKQLGDAIISLRIYSGVSGQIALESGSHLSYKLLTIQRGRILPLNE